MCTLPYHAMILMYSNVIQNGVVNDARIRKKRSSDGSSSGNRDHVVEFVDYHLKQYSADQNKKDYSK